MKVSIIISVYNGEKFIGRALRSCIEQDFPKQDYEIIVVNDGSTDNTHQVLDSFGEWIKVISLEKNMGLPYACNKGIRKALSKFIIRVDADDYIHSDLLRVGHLFLSLNSDIDALSCDYLLVNEKGKTIGEMSAEEYPIACGIMFRKDYLVDIGLYDESFLLGEDDDLRIRFQKKYSIYNIPLALYRYRRHDNNITSNIEMIDKYHNKLNEKHNL